MMSILLLLVVLLFIKMTVGFNMPSSRLTKNILRMEYIPDGLSKAQWAEMKKKEAEATKGKDLGKVGITKFQSRSFEAWQKSGQKNLFPGYQDFDPKAPLNERPYMQRPGGSADGSDLAKKGLKGIAQAFAQKKIDVDLKYEKLEKEGKLKSTTFSVPWSNEATAAIGAEKREALKKAKEEFNAKKGKTTPLKNVGKSAPTPEPVPEKKKFFGLF